MVSATNVQFSGLSLIGNQSSNYNLIIQENNAATITPLAIQVTAESETKIYGELDPILTFTNSPLIGNDLFSGSLIRAVGEEVGFYPILIGSLTLGPNYTIQYTSDTLKILASNLIIKPNPIIRTYGDAPLPSTLMTANFQVIGLKNNETIKTITLIMPTGTGTGNGLKDPVGIYKNDLEINNLMTGSENSQIIILLCLLLISK